MTPTIPKGLLRLDVARAARVDRGGWSSDAVLLVVTREGSPADRALDARFPDTVVAQAPRRVARQLPIDAGFTATLASVLDGLAACPIEPAARGTAPTSESALDAASA